MPTLDFRLFQRLMLPTLSQLRSRRMTTVDLAREVKEKPRALTSAEFLLLVANECRQMYSRREKNYE